MTRVRVRYRFWVSFSSSTRANDRPISCALALIRVKFQFGLKARDSTSARAQNRVMPMVRLTVRSWGGNQGSGGVV
jgi:hypothetical protein